jgi:hypothetical protein
MFIIYALRRYIGKSVKGMVRPKMEVTRLARQAKCC